MLHKATTAAFLAFIFAMFFLNIFNSPDEFSASERRRLAQFPELTAETAANGKFMEGFDDFAVDQAVFREPFRRIKAYFDISVLRKLDNNKIFVVDGTAFKTDYPLSERSVLRLCGIINSVYHSYIDGTNGVWYTLVPDKNAYLENSGHLVMDYGKLKALVRASLDADIACIDIFDDLSLESYYYTDAHWRQEYLFPAARTLADAMGVELNHKPFTENNFDAFYGVYYGQSALNMEPDTLIWLTSETTEAAVITNMDKPGQTSEVYDLSQLGAVDPYSIFMCGPASIVTAHNPAIDSQRRLILFRDSFASALSPLLLDAYGEITLIDLRYVGPEMLGQFVDFEGADVLFCYSAGLFNTSDSVRGVSADFISPFIAKSRIYYP